MVACSCEFQIIRPFNFVRVRIGQTELGCGPLASVANIYTFCDLEILDTAAAKGGETTCTIKACKDGHREGYAGGQTSVLPPKSCQLDSLLGALAFADG